MPVQPIPCTPIPIQTRQLAVAELLAMALIRRQQRRLLRQDGTVDDTLTSSRTRALIGTTNQRGVRHQPDDPTDNAAPIIAANHRVKNLTDGRA